MNVGFEFQLKAGFVLCGSGILPRKNKTLVKLIAARCRSHKRDDLLKTGHVFSKSRVLEQFLCELEVF